MNHRKENFLGKLFNKRHCFSCLENTSILFLNNMKINNYFFVTLDLYLTDLDRDLIVI